MSTRLSPSELNELVVAFQPMRCWRFGKYLGSMLTLDFGDQIDVRTHDSTIVTEGGLMIAIRNAYWVALDGERPIANAEEINDTTFADDLASRPIGAALTAISQTPDGQWIEFRLDNGFALHVDATNKWKTGGDIFEVTLPDGRIVVLDDEGTIEMLDEVEPLRAERWRSRLM